MNRLLLFFTLLLSYSHAQAQTAEATRLKQHVTILASDSLEGRGFGMAGGRKAIDYVEAQFASAAIAPWQEQYRHPFLRSGLLLKTEGTNIMGVVEGTAPQLKNEYIVVGAHLDHIGYKMRNGEKVVYNGADDNASGTAVLIELGRRLTASREGLKRSVILVAFDGEEAGLIGSNHIVKSGIIPPDAVKLMFSLDMVGMLSTYGGLDVSGNMSLETGDGLFTEVAARHGILLKKQNRKLIKNTDTKPFGQAGIPSVQITTTLVSPYHKPEDDAHLLDYEGMAKITAFMEDLLKQASGTELKPDKRFLADVSGRRIRAGFALGSGNSYHDYTEEFYNGKPVNSYHAGLFADIPFSRRFSLRPSVIYQTTGSKHPNGTFRTHEVSTPLNLRLNLIPFKSDLFEGGLHLLGGPYYTYKFGGKAGSDRIDFDNLYNRGEYGIQYGVALELEGMNLSFMNNYPLNTVDKAGLIKQHTRFVTVSWKF